MWQISDGIREQHRFINANLTVSVGMNRLVYMCEPSRLYTCVNRLVYMCEPSRLYTCVNRLVYMCETVPVEMKEPPGQEWTDRTVIIIA